MMIKRMLPVLDNRIAHAFVVSICIRQATAASDVIETNHRRLPETAADVEVEVVG